MGRKRTKQPPNSPDRISAGELDHWMKVNFISPHTLARELGLTYATVNNWLRGWNTTPRWLEQYINRASLLPKSKLPLYGKRWEDGRRQLDGGPTKRQFDIAPPPLDAAEPVPYDDRYDWDDE